MKKFLKVMAWILLVIGFVGLGVSTYLTSSGINEWWNENVAQWVGGASLSVACTALIQLVINYASKSNLDLGIKNMSKASEDFATNSEEIKKQFAELNTKYNEEIAKMKELVEHYEKTLKSTELANKKLEVVLDNEIEIAKHNSEMVKDGTAKKLIKNVEGVKVSNEEEGKLE